MSEQEQAVAPLSRQGRNSWLTCHRCAGTLLFDDAILCTGIFDNANLNVIDLHQLPRRASVKESESHMQSMRLENSTTPSPLHNLRKPAPSVRMASTFKRGSGESIARLDRFRIPMNGLVTAVSAHPNQHVVVCGGDNMRLQIVAVLGEFQP